VYCAAAAESQFAMGTPMYQRWTQLHAVSTCSSGDQHECSTGNVQTADKKENNASCCVGPFRRLYILNIIACALHGVQGVAMLVVSQAVDSFKSSATQITRTSIRYDATLMKLVPVITNVFKLEIGAMAASFLLLSFVAHAVVVFCFPLYTQWLTVGRNPFRWYEYALSSSVIICAVAILFGCSDLGSLILLFALNASMNMFGALMEDLNPRNGVLNYTTPTRWAPFVYGSVAGTIPWVVIGLYFFGSLGVDGIPVFVYLVFWFYLFFFFLFPLNMYLTYTGVWLWTNYLFGEEVYIILSLSIKTLLAWFVFAGTLQPN
jgi:hypothetical protein